MTDWTAAPYHPIEALTENLWRVEAQLQGSPVRRVMTVARRADGDLAIHSAIALSEADMAALDAFGRVRYVLVPNGFHRIDAPRFKRRYPEALVLCPSGSRKRVAAAVELAGTYEDFPTDPDVRLETLEGTGGREGAMLVRSGDGTTVVVNDVVFNMPHAGGVTGFVLKHVTRSTGGPRVSRLARLALVKDKAALRGHLQRLAETPGLVRLIVSHHQMVSGDAAGALLAAAADL